MTADNKGTLGNGIPILLNYLGPQGGQILPAGITASITAMAGGATDPSLASIATILGDMPFDYIVNPYSATLAITSATMSDQAGRWSYSAAIYGHVFSAPADTVANLITFGTGLNDQHLSVLGVNAASPTPAWIWAAALVGAIAPALDADPARPVQTLPIAGVLPAPSGSNWNFSNRQSLLTAGVAVAQRDAAGRVSVVRCVTTYQTNKFGQPDQSYLDVEIMTTLTAVVRALKAVVTQKFPRAKLADDGTRFGAGQPVVTPSIARGVVIAEYANLVDQGLCENETAFAAGLIVQRNANDNSRLDVLFDPYLVSGLRIFAVLTQFHLAAAA